MWIRPATKPDGFQYYEYVVVYVDDINHYSHNTDKTMHGIQPAYKLKKDSIAPPEMYLGLQLEFKMVNGVKFWTIMSENYVKAAFKNVDEKLAERGHRFSKQVSYSNNIEVHARIG